MIQLRNMKKSIKLIIMIFLLVTVAVTSFVACQRDGEFQDDGIVITFVTGFENDENPIIIEPRVSTLSKPAEMPDDPYKAGYRFLGWFYDEEGTLPFSTKDGLKTDTTLYAKWEKKRADAGESETPSEVEAPNGIVYRLKEDGNYAVTGYKGTATELSMTPSYEGVAVTSISEGAFNGNSTLKKIIIPSTVTEIEDGAFYGCSALETIEATASNETFSSEEGILYASDKTELVAVGQARTQDIALSNRVVKIRGYAFAGGVYSVSFKENSNLTVIGEYAFAEFDGKLTVAKNVKEIRRRAFYGSTAEISFSADCSVDKLAMGEFDGYIGKKLVLPSSVKSISGSPFYGATAEIDFSATGIKNLGEAAFAGYEGKTLFIPYFVETADNNCFYRCSSVITFDERTAYSVVGEYAFNQFCGEVVFPDTVKTVESYAFYAMRYGKVTYSAAKSEIVTADNAFLLCNQKNVNYIG